MVRRFEPTTFLGTIVTLFFLQVVWIGNTYRKRAATAFPPARITKASTTTTNTNTANAASLASAAAPVAETVPISTPTLPRTLGTSPTGSPIDTHTIAPTGSLPRTDSPSTEAPERDDNVLLIVLDQLRYDTLGYVQAQMDRYHGKFHIQTPHVDELARRGVSFQTAYCQSPSCAPSRATMKSGCTVARHGIVTNRMLRSGVSNKMVFTKQKIESLTTFEQMLAQKRGYRVESYGKWHFPTEFWDPVTYNFFDYHNESFGKDPIQQMYRGPYMSALDAFRSETNVPYRPGDQENLMSSRPYTPIQLDGRYGMPTKTSLRAPSIKRWMGGEGGICGVDALGENYTSTAMLGDTALRALDRLTREGDPFLLSVHFNAPHPPYVAAGAYVDHYWGNRSNLFISPSIRDNMRRSAYALSNQRDDKEKAGPFFGYDDPKKIAELTAVYYAMIEEVDHFVGQMVEKIDAAGLSNNTLIVFTSDHGELMGAHSMTGKGVLLEEAARVPLILVRPGKLPAGVVVREPVTHLDLSATLQDYAAGLAQTACDGSSLRRFIERKSFNDQYDERTVVLEMDSRYPLSGKKLNGKLGKRPNFMVRNGNHKLIITRKAKSKSIDMLYDLSTDPYEMKNLLPSGKSVGPPEVIGKAEHLKVLLLEFLQRHDGDARYYSSNKYHLGEGAGDISEIRERRQWNAVDYWQSDKRLTFGPPSLVHGKYTRVEYLYFGSTKRRTLKVQKVFIKGSDAQYFRATALAMDGYVRVRVAFTSNAPVAMSGLKATVVVKNSATGTTLVPITGEAQ